MTEPLTLMIMRFNPKDNLFPINNVAILDGFDSLIWTERFNSVGSFQIKTANVAFINDTIKMGDWILNAKTHRIMVVENILIESPVDGPRYATISGRSMEKILYDRSLQVNTTYGGWNITKRTRAYILLRFLDLVLYHKGAGIPEIPNGWSNARDYPSLTIIGSYTEDFGLPAKKSVSWTVRKYDSFGDAYFKALSAWKFGLTIGASWSSEVESGLSAFPQLYAYIYRGSNLTGSTNNTKGRQPVIFTTKDNSLFNTRSLLSEDEVKTVCYVYGNTGSAGVTAFPADWTGKTQGQLKSFDRREMHISFDDSGLNLGSMTASEIREVMDSQAQLAMADKQPKYVFDGDIDPNRYEYGTYFRMNDEYWDNGNGRSTVEIFGYDYTLGDLVRLEDAYGNRSGARVTEYTFTYDSGDGWKEYPTLEVLWSLEGETSNVAAQEGSSTDE